jgi:hypothetical protein
MNYLDLTGVVAGPKLAFNGTTIYSGYVQLTHNRGFRGIVRTEMLQAFQFFVPDSAPYTRAPATLAVELGLRRIQSGANPGMITFGACDERVALAADPRGGEHQWLQISFQTPIYEHRLVELNYRVTVQEA